MDKVFLLTYICQANIILSFFLVFIDLFKSDEIII